MCIKSKVKYRGRKDKMNMITKSMFVRALSCVKKIFLDKSQEDDALVLKSRRQEEGIAVGEKALELFDGAKMIFGPTIYEKVSETQNFIKNGTKAIAEASFMKNNLYCQVDVLETGDMMTINEVKAVTEIRCKSKKAEVLEGILADMAFQYYVLIKLGYNVGKVNCIHLNKDYKKDGEVVPTDMFVTEDVTEEVIAYVNRSDRPIETTIDGITACLDGNNEPESPLSTICFGCEKLSAQKCEHIEHCFSDMPAKNCFSLNGIYCKFRDIMYKNGYIDFREVRTYIEKEIDKLDPNKKADASKIATREKILMEVEAELDGKVYIKKDKIKAFLDELWFPMCHLDFETFDMAIPRFDGQWPYEKVPFQYSMHIVEKEGALPIHHEYLAPEGADPRREIAEKLVKLVPKDACVVVYNKTFERDRICEMAELYPDLAEDLTRIKNNIRDLMVPFKDRYYYNRDMDGSYSIKKVLPVFDPSMDYNNLEGIHKGDEAMETFLKLESMSDEDRVRERQALLEYCKRDTEAMIVVYEGLKKLIE